MKQGPDQIALPLDWPQTDGDARFVVSDSNRDAFEHFRKWSMWPVKATILTGPRRSGRTLLARSFVERVGGRLFDNAEGRDEEELFHAWNQAQNTGLPLVMVTGEAPPAWSPALPDLKTRLAVTPVSRIGHPDDVLFAALIQLHFADRGLHIPSDALRFMSERLHRDYWTAERAVEAIDRFAIAERARVSLPTVRRALAEARMIGNGELAD
jgi:chromosomal replication initiation ATPase DnaA